MPTKHSMKTNLYKQNIWKEISPQKIFQTLFLPKNYQQNCLPKKSQEIFPDKRFRRELSTKKFLKRHFPSQKNLKHMNKESLKRHSLPKTMKGTISHKTLWREMFTILWRESLPNKFHKKLLPKNLCEEQRLQKKRRQISTKKLSEETFLQKIEDASPPKNLQTRNYSLNWVFFCFLNFHKKTAWWIQQKCQKQKFQ